MPKKKEKVITSKELSNNLKAEYTRWKDIFDNGCSDPTWEDGVNINLVRSHILYEKKRTEEALKDNYIAYPNEYFYPEPVMLPNSFMAVERKLACRGEVFASNKTMCYNEAIQFSNKDWGEALCG